MIAYRPNINPRAYATPVLQARVQLLEKAGRFGTQKERESPGPLAEMALINQELDRRPKP